MACSIRPSRSNIAPSCSSSCARFSASIFAICATTDGSCLSARLSFSFAIACACCPCRSKADASSRRRSTEARMLVSSRTCCSRLFACSASASSGHARRLSRYFNRAASSCPFSSRPWPSRRSRAEVCRSLSRCRRVSRNVVTRSSSAGFGRSAMLSVSFAIASSILPARSKSVPSRSSAFARARSASCCSSRASNSCTRVSTPSVVHASRLALYRSMASFRLPAASSFSPSSRSRAAFA